ncbi:hypothetical protein PMKS-003407 [Pichia membranifaciens]|uniref:Uncharacterized protein n=1 Tax=Pichia membranifaciens TaxID=4926 RepID=A0A1Q2YKA2_9ASCO|nr:hypothetical protein PMKS-003407 [Pichia membranifaciens]
MLLNNSRYTSDCPQFASRVGRIGNVEEVLNLPYPQVAGFKTNNPNATSRPVVLSNTSQEGGNGDSNGNENPNCVYATPTNPRFTRSNMSSQNTLISQQTNSTVATILSESEEPYLIEKLEEIEANMVNYMHNPRRNSITSSIRIGKHFDNIYASKYSIHSCKKTSVTNVPKNNIVLINNMPYPLQLQFPAKISNRKSKEAAIKPNAMDIENKENMLNNYKIVRKNDIANFANLGSNYKNNSFIEKVCFEPSPSNNCSENLATSSLDKNNIDPRLSDSYDLLLQLIQSYID